MRSRSRCGSPRRALRPIPEEAAAIIAPSREELAAALEELRELARGIHPAVLTDRGLAAAVEALVVRTPVPVSVTMPPERLPVPIEAAAYYVVSEAVTNIVKYAGATTIDVTVESDETTRHRDRRATTGAAAPTRAPAPACAGCATASPRSTARSAVDSPADRGTRIVAEIPLEARPELARSSLQLVR